MEATPGQLEQLGDHVVLFDGECAFCDATVQFLLDRDPDGTFQFAPLQGPTAAAVMARHPELPEQLDSLILVRQTPDGETVAWWSGAAFGIAAGLGGIWRAAAWLRFLPRFFTDFGYRVFAANRIRLFGKLDQCRIPNPQEAARFLP